MGKTETCLNNLNNSLRAVSTKYNDDKVAKILRVCYTIFEFPASKVFCSFSFSSRGKRYFFYFYFHRKFPLSKKSLLILRWHRPERLFPFNSLLIFIIVGNVRFSVSSFFNAFPFLCIIYSFPRFPLERLCASLCSEDSSLFLKQFSPCRLNKTWRYVYTCLNDFLLFSDENRITRASSKFLYKISPLYTCTPNYARFVNKCTISFIDKGISKMFPILTHKISYIHTHVRQSAIVCHICKSFHSLGRNLNNFFAVRKVSRILRFRFRLYADFWTMRSSGGNFCFLKIAICKIPWQRCSSFSFLLNVHPLYFVCELLLSTSYLLSSLLMHALIFPFCAQLPSFLFKYILRFICLCVSYIFLCFMYQRLLESFFELLRTGNFTLLRIYNYRLLFDKEHVTNGGLTGKKHQFSRTFSAWCMLLITDHATWRILKFSDVIIYFKILPIFTTILLFYHYTIIILLFYICSTILLFYFAIYIILKYSLYFQYY